MYGMPSRFTRPRGPLQFTPPSSTLPLHPLSPTRRHSSQHRRMKRNRLQNTRCQSDVNIAKGRHSNALSQAFQHWAALLQFLWIEYAENEAFPQVGYAVTWYNKNKRTRAHWLHAQIHPHTTRKYCMQESILSYKIIDISEMSYQCSFIRDNAPYFIAEEQLFHGT